MQIEIMQINKLDQLNELQTEQVIDVYQTAFARLPYLEAFTTDESFAALQYILDRESDLLLGQEEGDVVSLAGGYMKDDNVYDIEELAVRPDRQDEGIGRTTLQALIGLGLKRNPSTLEIRTTASNKKAINLYKSEGFTLSGIREVVAQTRQVGGIALDERVILTKPIKEQSMQKEKTKLRRVAIAYPSGNTTAVVFDQLNKDNLLPNKQIINAWAEKASNQPGVEQCCFVTLPRDKKAIARVEMFGGEFCGNATRSVIQLITEGRDYKGLIEVSGVNKPLNFDVVDGVITLEMPLPQKGELAKIVKEGTLVQLDGIAQLVVTDIEQKRRSPRQILNDLLAENKYGLADQPAVGVSMYDPETTRAQFCVWVGGTVQTIFDETSCGSGTCAIGVAASLATGKNQTLEVIQPSGEKITTTATVENDGVVCSYISGAVRILYDGELAYDN